MPPNIFQLEKTVGVLDDVDHHSMNDVDHNVNREAVAHVDVDDVEELLKIINRITQFQV